MRMMQGFGRRTVLSQIASVAVSVGFAVLSGTFALAQQLNSTASTVSTVTTPPESATVPGNEGALTRRCVQDAASYRAMGEAWSSDPNAFLARYFGRGSSASVPVRNVLIYAPQAIDRMIAIMSDKATDPKLAEQIALGIGQATLRCSRTEPLVTLLFQEKMAQFANSSLMTAFTAALGDVGTAALGGGAVGSGSTGSGTSGQGGGGALSPNTTIGTFGTGGQSISVPQSGSDPVFSIRNSAGLRFLSSSSSTASRTTP